MSAELEATVNAEIADLDLVEAQAITGRIRAWVNALPIDDWKRAYFGRIWLAMGYDSWAEWCDCELDGFMLPAVERREVVAELSESGMSNRAIAAVVGVHHSTVIEDRRSGGGNPPPEPRPITGQDGKTYPQPPAPKPRRKPITDRARDAGWELRKAVERIERIAADDRFDSQIEKVTPYLRCHLINAIEVCQHVLDRIIATDNGIKE
jgi:hypothetical protein